MKAFSYDIDYLCSKMSDMSGLPIRIYRNDALCSVYSVVPLIADPILLHLDVLNEYHEHVNYHITEDFDYYGIINSDDLRIVLGPSRNSPLNNQELHDLAFALNVSARDMDAFKLSIQSIAPIPLDSIIQMICTINHILNNEKLNLSDFQIKETKIQERISYEQPSSTSDIYKNYNIENQVLDIVRSGNLASLASWIQNAPTVRPGILSSNVLRQNKNTFIVTTTLISRAAIEAGMQLEDSFKLSDSFIQKCENTNDLDSFNALQYEMVYTFTKEVSKLTEMTDDRLSNEIYHYVLHHISDPIRTREIADHLYMSRSYLSTLFKKQYGKNLNDYIHEIKISKAKELLQDHSKSIILISDYLGYSSSSHFNRVFKQITGISPKEYRKA
ncbi:MAG: helix-turn-helix domain-containing protein [Erysipelotrichaceae bacterium]|nr:helix-turn-helix domain-containing protein [Erysipelotrichaceae bacterium]